MKRKRVLILGGGFGGLYTALELEKRLARGLGVEVTLVNRENFFLFTPMLHEVAASDPDFTHIVNPVRKLLRRTKFLQGTAAAVDLGARRVTVSHGAEHRHELEYDYLVIALGAVANFYSLPGLAERALTMKSLGDAIHLRGQLIKNLEEADFEPRAEDRVPLLTFVVARGALPPHQYPPDEDEQHAPYGQERQVVQGIIRHLPDVVYAENLVVDNSFDEIKEPPAEDERADERGGGGSPSTPLAAPHSRERPRSVTIQVKA